MMAEGEGRVVKRGTFGGGNSLGDSNDSVELALIETEFVLIAAVEVGVGKGMTGDPVRGIKTPDVEMRLGKVDDSDITLDSSGTARGVGELAKVETSAVA